MTPEQRRVLVAVAERILPRDDWPGAADANVIGYIDWLAEQPYFGQLRRLLSCGLELLESFASAQFGRSFVDCSDDQQDTLLARVQAIPHPTARRFFAALVRMTIVGYVCDPRYGGNRDAIVWRQMGRQPDASGGPSGSLVQSCLTKCTTS
jgi:gluconate 2-dehydrogenase gamma chain